MENTPNNKPFENVKNREQKYQFLEDVPNWEDKLAAYEYVTGAIKAFEDDDDFMSKFGHGKEALPNTGDYIDILSYDKATDTVGILPRKEVSQSENFSDLEEAA